MVLPVPPPANAATVGSDGSDSDAPETVTLTQSKKHSQKHDAVIQQVHAAQKEKKRLRNQQRDKKLKEQAENTKKKRKAKEMIEDVGLQARMERVMPDGDEGQDHSTDEEWMGTGEGSSEMDDDDVGDDIGEEEDRGDDHEAYSEDESVDTASATPPSAQPRRNPKHLPDHLFTAAFSQAKKAASHAKDSSKRKATDDGRSSRSARKRARSNVSPKDLLIGYVSFQVHLHSAYTFLTGFPVREQSERCRKTNIHLALAQFLLPKSESSSIEHSR